MKVKPISYFYCFIKNAPVKILDMPISFNMDFLIKAIPDIIIFIYTTWFRFVSCTPC